MKQVEDILSTAFPEFDVVTQHRPDGSLLLSLQQGGRPVLRRALSYGQVQSRLQLDWVIGSLRRDLAIEAGQAPAIAALQSQSRIRLPRYEYR